MYENIGSNIEPKDISQKHKHTNESCKRVGDKIWSMGGQNCNLGLNSIDFHNN